MKNKVIVITGASSGIGAALARRLGPEGARLVLAARRESELRDVAAVAGGESLVAPADVTSRADVQRVLAAAVEAFGGVDVWVNNAGRGITCSVAELTDEDFDEMMRVNVKSALYGMQAVLPHFKERGRGQIINVSSLLGRIPYVAARSAYSAAKHALNALTASLRSELRESYPGIAVATVSPGVVATDFGLNALGGGLDSRQIPNAQPVEEVADVIAEVIAKRSSDVYTRPGVRAWVSSYYDAEEMAAFEAAGPPWARAPGVGRP